jgi:limonene-1,2-epoxide hydrolase
MTRRLTWLVLGLVMVGAMGCAPAPAPNQEAAATVQKFLAARQARSLDDTMDCFGDQPLMRTNLGVSWAGREAVRAVMAYRINDEYTVSKVEVVGNHATWSEHVFRRVVGAPAAFFDEDVDAVVVGGRIASIMTFIAGAAKPNAVLTRPAPLSTSTDLVVPLGIMLLVAAAVLVWPSGQPPRSTRATDGQLLAGLREYVARRG